MYSFALGPHGIFFSFCDDGVSDNPTCALYGKMLLEKSMIDPNLILVLVADCNLINGTWHKAS